MAARSAASVVLDLCDTPAFRDSLRYATHECFVDLSCSFSPLSSRAPVLTLSPLTTVATLLLLKLTKLFPEGVDLPNLISHASQLQATLLEFPGAQRFAMTLKIALERFAKSFSLEVPSSNPSGATGGATGDHFVASGPFADANFLTPFGASAGSMFPFLGNNHAQFDLQALPDSNWVGSELFPEWIKADAGEQDWSFGTALDDGIDRLFLPQ